MAPTLLKRLVNNNNRFIKVSNDECCVAKCKLKRLKPSRTIDGLENNLFWVYLDNSLRFQLSCSKKKQEACFNKGATGGLYSPPGAVWGMFYYGWMHFIWLLLDCRKRSGYCRNLGSLRAGTRHHGEFSVMGTPSLQPFLNTYWLTPVNDWPIVAKHANMTSSRGSINAAPATIRQNLILNAAWLNEQRSRWSPWCLVPALREPRLRQ